MRLSVLFSFCAALLSPAMGFAPCAMHLQSTSISQRDARLQPLKANLETSPGSPFHENALTNGMAALLSFVVIGEPALSHAVSTDPQAAMLLATTDFGLGFDLRGEAPRSLGPKAEGRALGLCETTACISSSEGVGTRQFTAPWTFNAEGKEPVSGTSAMSELLQLLYNSPNLKVVRHTENYILCEAARPLGMVDDVEFLLTGQGAAASVEVRSASRVDLPPQQHRSRLAGLLSALQTATCQRHRIHLSQKLHRTMREAQHGTRWREKPLACQTYVYEDRGRRAAAEFCASPAFFSSPDFFPPSIAPTSGP